MEQKMDGVRSMTGKDLTEEDAEDRNLWRSKMKDTYCIVEKS